MKNDSIAAEVVKEIPDAKHVISLSKPRPQWLINVISGCVWVTGAWVALGMSGVLQTWDVPADFIHKLEVTMPVATAILSALSRFIGVTKK